MTPATKLALAAGCSAILAATAVAVVIAVPAAAAPARSFDLPSFTEAEISTELTVKFAVGSAQSIAVDAANQADLDDLRLEVRGDRLYAWMQRDFWDFVSFRDHTVVVTATVPALHKITAGSASAVQVQGMTGNLVEIEAASAASVDIVGIDATSALIKASSSAAVRLSGTCVNATYQLSSSASVGARGFECTDLDIEATSSASALLFASGDVNAIAFSGADVVLAGHPVHVDDDEDSGGDITVLN
ncbi:MAG: hypothetical protein JWR51_3819 [Devosia sp.]|uniref:GIN domain-containing protein n=1 Tax=Devosia sp. TaxID=1871048 RepID=UPI00260C8C84|nr:DUF2807 domain-containing protein [Devosia sp.]MDB5530716.1 hypothetical protein [Devosia sp.]